MATESDGKDGRGSMGKRKVPPGLEAWYRYLAKQRASKLTPEERSEIARRAARARWGKQSRKVKPKRKDSG